MFGGRDTDPGPKWEDSGLPEVSGLPGAEHTWQKLEPKVTPDITAGPKGHNK